MNKIKQCKGRRHGDLIKKILITIMLIIFIMPSLCFADEEETEEENDIPELVQAASISSGEPDINSRAAIVYDRASKEIIYGKEEKTKKKMASTTKIMTATVVLENSKLTDTLQVSKKSAGIGGSRLGLKTGDKISVGDLLYGLMLCSGNDAAVALAEHVGGSIEGFSQLMNKKAQELGMTNTHFVTPHGLDNDDHYTTAYELACLTDYALKNKTFTNIVGTKNYTVTINGRVKNISNTNELLGSLDGVYGVKTGFTNGANRCLVTSTKRGNLDIITIVLGADTKKFRTQDSIKLINYACENYETVDIKDTIEKEFDKWKQENLKKICINKGQKARIDLEMQIPQNTNITIRKSQKESINVNINSLYFLEAPINRMAIIGNLCVKVGGEEKMVIDIVSREEIKKKDVKDYFKLFIQNYMRT